MFFPRAAVKTVFPFPLFFAVLLLRPQPGVRLEEPHCPLRRYTPGR